MMQAHRSECTTTRAEQYRAQFLLRSTLMCAGVLVGSAIIMWVAANWPLWSHAKRIALVTVAFTVPLLFAGRQGRYHPKDWAKPFSLSSIALLVAALMTGALLALLGQVYHSGADSWRLFAWWAVLLVPWAVGLQSIPIILLSWFLTNVSIGLLIVTSFYFSAQYVMSTYLAAWNALWFLLLLLWRAQGNPWVWALRALCFTVAAFSFALAVVEYAHYHHADALLSWPLGLGFVFLAFIAWLMLRWRDELLAWVGFSAAGLILVFHLSFTVLPHMGLGIYALLLVPLAALWLFAHMRRTQRLRAQSARPPVDHSAAEPSAAQPTKPSLNQSQGASEASSDTAQRSGASSIYQRWPLRGMRVLVLVVAAVFWVSFLSVWGSLPLPVLAWFLFALSMLLGVTQPWRRGRWWFDLWLMTWVGSLITITVVWSRGEFSALGFVIVFLLAMLWYLWARAPMVRALTAAWLVFICWAWPWVAPHSVPWQTGTAVFDLRFALLYAWVFLLAGAYHWLDQARQRELQPLLAASGFWLIVIGLASWWVAAGWAQPGFGVPILSSVAAFVLVATVWLSLSPTLGGLSTVVVAAGALGVAFVWWPNPWLVMAFTGIVYAGVHQHRAAMYLFLACFMFVLVRWYDATYISLLEKVGRLLIGAGLIGTLSLALEHVFAGRKKRPVQPSSEPTVGTSQQSAVSSHSITSSEQTAPASQQTASQQTASVRDSKKQGRMTAMQWIALGLGAVAIYSSSAWYLYVQERILKEGVSFELSLLPADPRSLMQGDYMSLRFGLSMSIRLLQKQHPEIAWPRMRLRVWVMPTKRQGARLYAVQVDGQDYLVQRVEHPLEAQLRGSDPHPNYYLIPITQPQVLQRAIPIMMEMKFGEWTPDGVNAWYFAEGQGMALTGARWGRFKASGNGAVVLEDLLNEKQEPIESR